MASLVSEEIFFNILVLLFIIYLCFVSIIDVKTKKIKNHNVLILLLLSFFIAIISVNHLADLWIHFLAMFLGMIALWPAWKRGFVGGGDLKIMAPIAMVDPFHLFQTMIFAYIFSVVSILLKQKRYPFAPFLSLGFICALFIHIIPF